MKPQGFFRRVFAPLMAMFAASVAMERALPMPDVPMRDAFHVDRAGHGGNKKSSTTPAYRRHRASRNAMAKASRRRNWA